MSFHVKTGIVLVQCRKYVQYIFHVSHLVAGISEPGGVLKIVMVWVQVTLGLAAGEDKGYQSCHESWDQS